MLDMNLVVRTDIPLYRQIVEQIQQMISSYQLIPGDQVPTVRSLAQTLHVSPATVARAYQELGQKRILIASRRRGTSVMEENGGSQSQPPRQGRLAGTVNNIILESLSRGYKTEELESAFSLQIARWHIQQAMQGAVESFEKEVEMHTTFRIAGSSDMSLELLLSRFKYEHPEISLQLVPAGSLGGLLAIEKGSADVACIQLLDEEAGENSCSYIRHTIHNIEVAMVHLADRILGFIVAKGNPKHIVCLEDLSRPDVTFVNRQKGTGARVWLDHKLRTLGILPHSIKGYNRELDAHVAGAMGIAGNEADVALGVQAASVSCSLDFVPLTGEKLDLVIPIDTYHKQIVNPLLDIIRSDTFKKVVAEIGGYDTTRTGETTFIK